ncbi:hypothetical protein KEJ51_04655 [Candidatus Bathyarchaeota archaeon]|nr:hypothetical protein [Candidatus Bathyarchaeota archaeon]MBS7628696.1 hypothetical protein [Candidatus Bathyarchaeota archaeon]
MTLDSSYNINTGNREAEAILRCGIENIVTSSKLLHILCRREVLKETHPIVRLAPSGASGAGSRTVALKKCL